MEDRPRRSGRVRGKWWVTGKLVVVVVEVNVVGVVVEVVEMAWPWCEEWEA